MNINEMTRPEWWKGETYRQGCSIPAQGFAVSLGSRVGLACCCYKKTHGPVAHRRSCCHNTLSLYCHLYIPHQIHRVWYSPSYSLKAAGVSVSISRLVLMSYQEGPVPCWPALDADAITATRHRVNGFGCVHSESTLGHYTSASCCRPMYPPSIWSWPSGSWCMVSIPHPLSLDHRGPAIDSCVLVCDARCLRVSIWNCFGRRRQEDRRWPLGRSRRLRSGCRRGGRRRGHLKYMGNILLVYRVWNDNGCVIAM